MQDHVWRPRRAAKYFINLRPVKAKPKRRLLSMRPEKRPQTIMEQYRHRELLREEHNRMAWERQRLDWQILLSMSMRAEELLRKARSQVLT
jgi:hypothetical protein